METAVVAAALAIAHSPHRPLAVIIKISSRGRSQSLHAFWCRLAMIVSLADEPRMQKLHAEHADL